jgi:hypothetical protein
LYTSIIFDISLISLAEPIRRVAGKTTVLHGDDEIRQLLEEADACGHGEIGAIASRPGRYRWS